MCQVSKPLVAHGPSCYIGQCEHGTVFLVWNYCTWCLHPDDFRGLERFLEAGAATPLDSLAEGVRVGTFALVRDPTRTRLWFGEAGLALKHADFEGLRALVARGAACLDSPGGRRGSVLECPSCVGEALVN